MRAVMVTVGVEDEFFEMITLPLKGEVWRLQLVVDSDGNGFMETETGEEGKVKTTMTVAANPLAIQLEGDGANAESEAQADPE